MIIKFRQDDQHETPVDAVAGGERAVEHQEPFDREHPYFQMTGQAKRAETRILREEGEGFVEGGAAAPEELR